jgi:hypothetical protein
MEYIAITPAMAAAVTKVATEVIVPGWAKRSGPDAKAAFNQYLGPHTGITIP